MARTVADAVVLVGGERLREADLVHDAIAVLAQAVHRLAGVARKPASIIRKVDQAWGCGALATSARQRRCGASARART